MKREVYVVWFTPNKDEQLGTYGWPSMDGPARAHEGKLDAESAMAREPKPQTGTLSVKRFVEAKLRRKK